MRVFPVLILLFSLQPTYSQQKNESAYHRFGIDVDQPFLWLENIQDERTQEWLKDQEELKWNLLKKSSKSRFKYRLRYNPENEITDFNRYQFSQYQYDKKPTILKYREDVKQSFVSILNCADYRRNKYDTPSIEKFWLSPNEKYLIVALTHSGNDWLEFVVIDMDEKEHLYTLSGIMTPWLVFKEGGFIYNRFDIPTNTVSDGRINQRISFHRFNGSQETEDVIFRNADKTGSRLFQIFYYDEDVSRIYVHYPFKIDGSWKKAISVVELSDQLMLPEPFLIYESDYRIDFYPIHVEDSIVYFRTNLNAGNYSIIKCDTRRLNQIDLFQEEVKQVMTDAVYLGANTFGITYLEGSRYSGIIKNFNGESKQIKTPPGAFIEFFQGTNGVGYFSLITHYLPRQLFEVSLSSFDYNPLPPSRLRTSSQYKVENLSYMSDDGQVIPIQLVYTIDKEKERTERPTLMEVYGGYGTILAPVFKWEYYYFLESGGMLAFPSIRGGGDLGTEWELSGKGLNKKTSVNDAIDAAEFLTEKGYTSSEELFIEGGSHGGFIAAASAITRPDLFKGVITSAGVFDLIRQKDFSVRSMELNLQEFGYPNDSIDFLNLYSLSPIYNIEPDVDYPSFFIMAGLNDSRVPVSNSFRLKALLDEHSANDFNILHVTDGGHEIASYPRQQIELMGMKFQFIYELTGFKPWNP